MNSKPDIEFVHKIDDVDAGTPAAADPIEKAEGEDKPIVYYAVGRDSALERIFDSVLDTIAGKNKAGKGIGQFKNLVTWIFPATQPGDWITDEIGDFIKSKRTQTVMETTKEKILRILKQPSTKAALGLVVTVIASIFSLNINGEEVATVVTQSAIGIITGLAGLYTIYRNLRNVFTDDAKETANK